MASALSTRRWLWVPAVLVALAAGAVAVALNGQHLLHPFEYGCGVLVVIGVGLLVWYVDPAWTVSAAVVLTVFSGNWQNMGLPGFPFLPDRLLLAGGLIALLLRAPGARDRPEFQRRGLHWLLALASTFAVADALAAHTLTTNEGFFKLLDRFGLVPFLVFSLAPLIYRTDRQRRILLGFMVGLGAYLGLMALFETTGPKFLVIPHYLSNPNLGLSEQNSQGVPIDRARGPFLDAISNGLALFGCGVAAAVALTIWRRLSARVLATVVVVLSLLGCVFTLQRTVWLAAVVGVLAAMVWNARLRRYVIPTLVLGAAVTALALVFIPGLSQRASTRLNDQWTVWDRQNLTAAGVRMLGTRPLLGFGWDRFHADEAPYLIQPSTYPLTAHGNFIHNTFLSNAVELGMVGALLWLVAMLGALLSPLRRGPPIWSTSLVALVAFWAITAWLYPLPGPFPTMFVLLWAGVVDAIGREPAYALASAGRRRRWSSGLAPTYPPPHLQPG